MIYLVILRICENTITNENTYPKLESVRDESRLRPVHDPGYHRTGSRARGDGLSGRHVEPSVPNRRNPGRPHWQLRVPVGQGASGPCQCHGGEAWDAACVLFPNTQAGSRG